MSRKNQLKLLISFKNQIFGNNFTKANMATKKDSTENCDRHMTRSQTLKQQLTDPQIEHDERNSEYFFRIGTDKAFLSFDKCNNLIVMQHTEVPATFSGKGLGKLLAKVSVYGK